MAFVSAVQTITDLRGPAGRLEALLNTGRDDAPYAALVAHPHPLFGGTMHNKVVYHAMKAFTSFGLPVLRFNFRGNGLSEGVHDNGRGEVDDVRAALDYLTALLQQAAALRRILLRFLHRSACHLRRSPQVAGIIGLGLPVQAAGRDYTYEFLDGCTQPKLFISGDHDEFCPSDVLQRVAATSPGSFKCIVVPGADHFFAGIPSSPKPKLDQMQSHLRDWLAQNFQLELTA